MSQRSEDFEAFGLQIVMYVIQAGPELSSGMTASGASGKETFIAWLCGILSRTRKVKVANMPAGLLAGLVIGKLSPLRGSYGFPFASWFF